MIKIHNVLHGSVQFSKDLIQLILHDLVLSEEKWHLSMHKKSLFGGSFHNIQVFKVPYFTLLLSLFRFLTTICVSSL